MRIPEYLSPTSIALWASDRTEFALKYLCDNQPPRMPQTAPMAVGSSFDAFIKNELVKALYGSTVDREEFEFDTIFKEQVEEQCRVDALIAGRRVFDQYVACGAFADLLANLRMSQMDPRFEFTLEGSPFGVPLLGKPDLYYNTRLGARVVEDFKVNGYYANRKLSPAKGYLCIRDGWDTELPASKNNHDAHRDAVPFLHNGITINYAISLQDVDKAWARQLAIYAWLLGEEVGSDFVVGIQQALLGGRTEAGPFFRFATIRCLVDPAYQHSLKLEIEHIWSRLQNGDIFDNMTIAESEAKIKMLNGQAAVFNRGTDVSALMTKISRRHRY